MHHANQRAALMAAAKLVEELPPGTTFAVEVTDEDTLEEPSVLNIYLKPHQHFNHLASLLRLGEPVDQTETFVSYRMGPLLVSLMEPEEDI